MEAIQNLIILLVSLILGIILFIAQLRLFSIDNSLRKILKILEEKNKKDGA